MSSILTVDANPQHQYYFPLPKTHRSSSFGETSSSKKPVWANHSRQYTVCLGAPVAIDAGTDAGSSRSQHQHKSSDSHPHRTHAHRRSAAISHDFTAEWKNNPQASSLPSPSQGQSITATTNTSTNSNSLAVPDSSICTSTPSTVYSLQSPALTFTSSSSSLPGQSVSSATSLDSPKMVQFAHQTTSTTTNSQSASETAISRPVSLSKNSSSDSLPSLPSSGKRTGRHEKVKSWAGSVIRFSRHNDHKIKEHKSQELPYAQSVESSSSEGGAKSPESELFSSSYVSRDDLHPSQSAAYFVVEPEPLIDLDLALAPTTDGSRRSDSGSDGVKNLRNKMGAVEEAVTEEEEEDDCTPQYNYLGSPYRSSSVHTGSTVSINSSHSSLHSYERVRYSRSTQLMKAVTPPTSSNSSSMPPPPAPHYPAASRQGANVVITDLDHAHSETIRRVGGHSDPTFSTSCFGDENRLSIISNDTITEKHVGSSEVNCLALSDGNPSTTTNNNESTYDDTFALGQPGFIRYSGDSDRLSSSTIGTTSGSATTPYEVPSSFHEPSPTSFQMSVQPPSSSPSLNPPAGISSFETPARSKPLPKSTQARQRQSINGAPPKHRNSLSVESSAHVDNRSLRSVTSMRKRASRVLDWLRRR